MKHQYLTKTHDDAYRRRSLFWYFGMSTEITWKKGEVPHPTIHRNLTKELHSNMVGVWTNNRIWVHNFKVFLPQYFSYYFQSCNMVYKFNKNFRNTLFYNEPVNIEVVEDKSCFLGKSTYVSNDNCCGW